MKRRTLSLLLALAFILLLMAGCGSQEAESTPTEAPATDSPATDTPEDTPDEPEDPGETPAEDPKAHFPLAEEEVVFTFFASAPQAIGRAIESFNDNSVYKRMLELTNVNFEFISPPQELAGQQFNIVIGTGDYPDVMSQFSQYYAPGYDAAIDEGVIQPLNDVVEEYMPSYYAFLQENPDINKKVHSDTGNLWGIGGVTLDSPAEWGPMIRQDWLEEAGLDTPITLADWEEALTAFRDNGHPGLILMNTGYPDFFGNAYPVLSAFGVTGIGTAQGAPGFINDNGTAVFTPLLDGYKDYLLLMQDWFSKGLIDPDFMSITQMTLPDMIANEETGIFCWNWSEMDPFEEMTGNPDCDIEPIPNPVINEGDELHLYNYNDPCRSGTCFSGNLSQDDLGILLRYFDYFWTDEGYILKNFGVEGEGFEFDENGEPAYTELIYDNPNESWSMSLCLDVYTLNNGVGPGNWEGRYYLPTISDSARLCNTLWSNDGAYYFPSVTLTSDESSESSSILAEIQTYVSEYTLAAIVGETDIEATWADYCSTIEGFNSDRLTDIYQAALDRYLAR